MLNDVINAETRTLTDNEKMLFDPSYAAGFSRWPLLYTPFAVSKEVRGNIIKIARQSEDQKVDIRDFLLESVTLGTSKDSEYKGKRKKTKTGSFLGSFFKRSAASPIIFEKQLMEKAYDDLTNRVGGRDFLSEYQLYSPKRHDEMIRNDYMDPSLLLMEELENRDYGIHLFRIAAPSGASKRTVDGLDECIVALVSQKARAALNEFRWGPMSILNGLYRGRGILYSTYIDRPNSWGESGFSEEERNRLIAFARPKEVDDEKSNYALRKKTPDVKRLNIWIRLKKKCKN